MAGNWGNYALDLGQCLSRTWDSSKLMLDCRARTRYNGLVTLTDQESRLIAPELDIEEKFWASVDVLTGPVPSHVPEVGRCFPWLAAKWDDGYGRIHVRRNARYAHRISWTINYGDIPAETPYVCHRCDNKECVRPEHLFLGTPRDNILDMMEKGRWAGGRPREGDQVGKNHVCVACGRKRKNQGRGLCGGCHEHHRTHGTLDQFARRR